MNSIEFSKNNIALTRNLIKLNDLLVFRNTLMKRELDKVSKELTKNKIKFVVLKGMALDTLDTYTPGIRFSRDIDILIAKDQIEDAFEIVNGCGYRYLNNLAKNRFKFFGNSHQVPPLVNDKKIVIELHHRVTSPKFYNECPITEAMFRDLKFQGNIPVPSLSCLIAHSLYHGLTHHNLNMGPIFLFDINEIINTNDLINIDESIIEKFGYLEAYRRILNLLSLTSNGEITNDVISKIDKLMIGFDWTKKDEQKVKLFSRIKSDREKRFNFNMVSKKIKTVQYKYQVELLSLGFLGHFLLKFTMTCGTL